MRTIEDIRVRARALGARPRPPEDGRPRRQEDLIAIAMLEAGRPLHVSELAAVTEIRETSIYSACSRATVRGRFLKIAPSTFALAESEAT